VHKKHEEGGEPPHSLHWGQTVSTTDRSKMLP
jgi:hypothetical protein